MTEIQLFENLSLDTITKSEIVSLCKSRAEQIIEDGESEKYFAWLKKVEVLVKSLKDEIIDSAITEVYKGGDFYFGVKMNVQEKKTYSYDHDETWVKLKEKLKKHEELMKALQKDQEMLDDETGELTLVKQARFTVSSTIVSKF